MGSELQADLTDQKSHSEINIEKMSSFDELRKGLAEKSSHITFLEEDHLYLGSNQENYRSISSILGEYTEDFDRDEMSNRVSRRERVPVQEIKTRWDIRRDLSIVRGTEFHLYAETFLNEGRKIETITPIEKEIAAFHLFWDERNRSRYDVVATEVIVVDDELKMAGTVDCIVRHQETKNYFIFDWKTNRNIRKENKYKTKLLGPLSHLDDCEFNKYSLQMGFYSYLLANTGLLDIKKCFLIHLCPEMTDPGYRLPYQVYQTQHYKEEVDAILKELSEQKDENQ